MVGFPTHSGFCWILDPAGCNLGVILEHFGTHLKAIVDGKNLGFWKNTEKVVANTQRSEKTHSLQNPRFSWGFCYKFYKLESTNVTKNIKKNSQMGSKSSQNRCFFKNGAQDRFWSDLGSSLEATACERVVPFWLLFWQKHEKVRYFGRPLRGSFPTPVFSTKRTPPRPPGTSKTMLPNRFGESASK